MSEDKASLAGARIALAVPLILVNASAIWGQYGWAVDHLGGGALVALGFALAVESVGFYLAVEAHSALLAGHAAGLLRYGSYLVGLLAALLNYWHWRPTGLPAALAFAALSALSPVLWGVYSRARNRTRLAALGLVDERAPKFSTARKLYHPVKTLRAASWAAWAGVSDPRAAVEGWEAGRRNSDAVSPVRAAAEVIRPIDPASERTFEVRPAELAESAGAETSDRLDEVDTALAALATELEGLPSDRAKVRRMAEHLGTQDRAVVLAALAEHGIEVSPDNARKTLRDLRKMPGQSHPDTPAPVAAQPAARGPILDALPPRPGQSNPPAERNGGQVPAPRRRRGLLKDTPLYDPGDTATLPAVVGSGARNG